MTSPPQADASTSAAPASTGYGRLARQISGWTTNLLATAIVLVAGIALGWQVLVWWGEAGPPPIDPTAAAAPAAEVESREFWTAAGPLRIERLMGAEDAALAAMRVWCLDGQPLAEPGDAGPGETQLLSRLAEQTPLEQVGDLALYQPPEQMAAGPLMLVAVSRSRGRIVAWSFALPADNGGPLAPRAEALGEPSAEQATPPLAERADHRAAAWSLYHFRPAAPGAITTASQAGSNVTAEGTP